MAWQLHPQAPCSLALIDQTPLIPVHAEQTMSWDACSTALAQPMYAHLCLLLAAASSERGIVGRSRGLHLHQGVHNIQRCLHGTGWQFGMIWVMWQGMGAGSHGMAWHGMAWHGMA